MTTANNNTATYAPDALAALRERKREVRAKIEKSKLLMALTTKAMYTPPKATNRIEALMNMVDQGMAIYDGVMIGMRLMQGFKRVFGHRRH